jgi:hypothetical protein
LIQQVVKILTEGQVETKLRPWVILMKVRPKEYLAVPCYTVGKSLVEDRIRVMVEKMQYRADEVRVTIDNAQHIKLHTNGSDHCTLSHYMICEVTPLSDTVLRQGAPMGRLSDVAFAEVVAGLTRYAKSGRDVDLNQTVVDQICALNKQLNPPPQKPDPDYVW